MRYDVTFVTIFNLKQIGGVSTYVANLSSGLAGNHYKVKTISLGNLPLSHRLKTPSVKFGQRPVSIFHYQLARIALFIIALPYLLVSKVIACQDIISFNTFFFFAKLTRKKIILHIHSRMPQELISEGYLLEKQTKVEKFLENEEKKAFARAKIAIAAGKNNFKYCAECMSKDLVYSFINFTNIDEFTPPKNIERVKAKKSFKIPNSNIIIGAVTRLTDRKGIEYLIKAVSELPKRYQLLIAGDGPNKNSLIKLADNLNTADRINFLGNLEGKKLKTLYKAIDVLVVPSIKIRGVEEATSLSAIEALSCSVPIVVTKVGGLPQLIDVCDKPNGIIVPQKNPKAISKAIMDILDNHKCFKASARSFAELNCSHVKQAKEIAKIYGI